MMVIVGLTVMLIASNTSILASGRFYQANNVITVSDTGTNTVGGSRATFYKAGTSGIYAGGIKAITTGNTDSTSGTLATANDYWSTYVANSIETGAYTGGNTIAENSVRMYKAHADTVSVSGDSKITTGNATAVSRTWTVVNTTLSFN